MAQESEKEHSICTYQGLSLVSLETQPSWKYMWIQQKMLKKKKKRSLGLQNASIFHLCIVAGSRQNFYGPLNQNKMIFLYHFIEYNKEGKEFVLFTYFERVLLSNTLGYSACQ